MTCANDDNNDDDNNMLTFAISDNFSSLSLVNSSLIFSSSLTLIGQGETNKMPYVLVYYNFFDPKI